MTQSSQSDTPISLSAIILGFCIGAVYALFKLPRSGRDLRHNLTSQIVPDDPIEQSLSEGKAAAHQRQAQRQN